MPTPIILRNSKLSFRTARAIYGSDSAKSVCAQQPSGALAREDCAAFPLSLRPFGEYAACSVVLLWLFGPARQHNPYQHRDSPSGAPVPEAVPLRSDPMLAPEVSRHAHEPRRRLSIAGFHSRLQASCVCSLFFPRSVGFGPTASCAKGALTIAPSMLCQAQAMPSNSSYSASPFRHSRTNTPARFHAWKYLWIELALPNRSSGNAFHWHPVRNTYTIPSNTLRASSGLRPPPGFLRYFRPFSRFRLGISGSTLAHIVSDTVQDLIAFMTRNNAKTSILCQNIIYG
jgi:hypothetical protein